MSVLTASIVSTVAAASTTREDLPNWFVCAMGIGTVFIGLICLIVLCSIIGAVYRKFGHSNTASPAVSAPATPAPAAPAPSTDASDIPNRQQFVAAVSAVIAEEMGTDVSKLRILSIKKI